MDITEAIYLLRKPQNPRVARLLTFVRVRKQNVLDRDASAATEGDQSDTARCFLDPAVSMYPASHVYRLVGVTMAKPL